MPISNVNTLPESKRKKANDTKPKKCKVQVKSKQTKQLPSVSQNTQMLKEEINKTKQMNLLQQNNQMNQIKNSMNFMQWNQLRIQQSPMNSQHTFSPLNSTSSTPEPFTSINQSSSKGKKRVLLTNLNLTVNGMKYLTRTAVNNRIDDWLNSNDDENSTLPYYWCYQ